MIPLTCNSAKPPLTLPEHPPPPPSFQPPRAEIHPISLLPSTELEAEVGAEAPTSASVLISPSPLKALRERGIKGVRVPLWGWGGSPFSRVIPMPREESGVGRPVPIPFHWGWGRRLASASDTNPLTLPEHPCYSSHRSNTNLTISRRNQKPREAHPTHPRTQRPSPSQRPIHGARGSSNRRHLLIPRSRAPFPGNQAMEDALVANVPCEPPLRRPQPLTGNSSLGRHPLFRAVRSNRPGAEVLSAPRPLNKPDVGDPCAPGHTGKLGYITPARGPTPHAGRRASSPAPMRCSQPPGAGLGPVGPHGPCLIRRVRAEGRSSGKGRPSPLPQGDESPAAQERGQRPASVFHRQLPDKQTDQNRNPHN